MEHDSIPHSKPVRIAGTVADIYLFLGIVLAAITAFLMLIGVIPLTGGRWMDLLDVVAGILGCLLASLFIYLIVELFHVLSRILASLIEIKELLREREEGRHPNAE